MISNNYLELVQPSKTGEVMDSSLLGSVLLSEMWNVSKTGVILSSPSLEGKMFGRNQKWLVKTQSLLFGQKSLIYVFRNIYYIGKFCI